ncbi:MAG TPA: peptidylprolyl isomerase [Planctomycetota bacterium]|nr:peptidylprolyl isomerase [Planctomycetota bacterium]
MAVQERDYMKGGGSPVGPSGGAAKILDRLNEIGERHATAIIAVSTGLIILTVLLFAKYFYDKSQVERAESELSSAETLEQFVALKTKYGTTPVAPRILFRLANKYYEEGKLDDARNAYLEFQTRFPNDRLGVFLVRALNSLKRNSEFDAAGKEARLKQHLLSSHPRGMADAKDPRLQWGPLPEPSPVVQIELPGGTLSAELFEDDAPNAVAAFIKLAELKYFDGAKWDVVGGDERIQTQPKAEGAQDLTLAVEDSKKLPEAYSLVLAKKDSGVSGSQFQILLRPLLETKDATVFGRVTSGSEALKSVKKDDVLKAVKVVSKRSHPYEPQPIQK